jgi:AraC family transcriptional regulator
VHGDEYEGDVHSLQVVLQPALARCVGTYRWFHGDALCALGLRLFREFRRANASVTALLESLAVDLVSTIVDRAPDERHRGMPPWMGRVVEQLHDRAAERLRVGQLAESVGLHPVYLARAFRRHHGCTLGEYQRSVRLASASDRLSGGREPIARIAVDSGFADQAHFTRAFRDHFGLTPARFRRLHASQASLRAT